LIASAQESHKELAQLLEQELEAGHKDGDDLSPEAQR